MVGILGDATGMQIQEADAPKNTMRLETFVEDTVFASKVEVQLTIRSSSSVRSAEASRAVAEIAEFLSAAGELGIAEDQVEIHAATVAEGKGIFGRGSTASFALTVRDVPTDKLVGLLQTATRMPHTTHHGTRWCFDVPEDVKVDLLRRVSAKAKQRADVAAEALGVKVTGVMDCQLNVGDEHGGHMMNGAPSAAPKMRSASGGGGLGEVGGIELVKRIDVRATAQVTFRLGS